ncbi:SGNH/GDSL hydrolase family protein [Staphylococcus epidermidis]|uniref:Tail protein n=1 Tax=Staphylococcus phage HS09 TaxID=3056401 RepID=A0AA49X4W7_9VIRU|nr:SGNH/GDSL hydrolase family protein [Staphylococcus epidermidis]WLJ25771.1 MAG: tail protein [Staphylococcus phage HS09]DAI80406.1 MAG TPA: tail protein [Caudoviricetes sp.]MDH8913868.1 SGNH/GDSL hydrolase family protein [Staphylococcus epidermidis]MDH8942056.1 SGNH/GDSL hydrolase family protein [Staphylococcus epidermidis]MDH9660567.1 SGNH/GDSL hydrolase family protein [Staphylococcus epidermidis]
MPILLKTLQGVGQSLPVETKLNEKLNEDGSLEIEMVENKATFDAIGAITKMWTITGVAGANDVNEYRIVMLDKTTIGQKEKLTIKARPVELDDLNNLRVYEVYNGSFTGKNYFDLVFRNTGYKYELHAKVSSSKFENLGNHDTNLELFKKGLERYNLEYEYNAKTKTFHLYDIVQRKANYYIKAGVNANNVKVQEDASKCYTYIRGYGGFDEQQTFNEASLQYEYTHPLADLIGKRHAPPVVDGRITKGDTLKKAMELVIQESLKTSVTLDFISLQKHFKEAIPKVGDIVNVIDDLIGLNEYVRIIEITTHRDINNKIIKQDVVLGEFRLQDRYMKAVNSAANYVKAIKSNKSDPAKDLRLIQAQNNANTKTAQELQNKTDEINNRLKNTNAKSVTTSNGTIIHDFTSKSIIRKVKTIGTIGDSVAKGTGAKSNFTEMLAKKIKAKATNLAVSGATMSTTKENSIYEQANNIKGDLIIVQGTDDDWNNNVKIGTDKADVKTFYGAFYSTINTLKNKYPDSKILVMTATKQCYVKDKKIVRKDTNKNELGLTLEDYCSVQIDICNELDVPVYDAYHSTKFKPNLPSFRKSSMPDGVHPNDKGHEVIMYELIKNFYGFYG